MLPLDDRSSHLNRADLVAAWIVTAVVAVVALVLG